uniref:Uncharacterized protein n=1 Tax=Panagrolaimus sp. JU765 TaxID=591449 RepID=A0AC34PYE7_9BILA
MQCFELGRGDGGVFFVSTLHELATSESTENELDSFLDSCFDSETTPPTILALNRRNAWKNRERQMARVRKKLKMLGIGKIGLFFDKKIQICAGNETYAVDSFLKPVPFRTELEVETKGSRFLQVFLEPDSEAIKIKCPVAEVIQLNLELTSEFNLRIWSNVVVSALNPLPNFYPRFYLGQTVCKVSTWKAGKETFSTIGGEFEFENGLVFATSGETRLKTDEKVDGIFVSDLLSLMDKKYSELDSNLASEFVATKDDKFLIQIKLGNSTRFLTPKNAFVLFLKQLKKLAELDSEDPITFVEMMVPNNLVLSQLAAILEASRLAGLRIVFSSFN